MQMMVLFGTPEEIASYVNHLEKAEQQQDKTSITVIASSDADLAHVSDLLEKTNNTASRTI